MRTWLLCGDTGEVLSSCETFRMSSSNQCQNGWTHAVASVFTEPALRGRRYASVLTEMLMRELAQRESDLHASILFSDVGSSLYERAGFEAVPSARDWVFPAEAGSASELADQLIAEGDVRSVWAELSPPSASFVIWPGPEQVDWHLERERTYSSLLSRERPESCGARVGRSIVVWAAKYATDELILLWLAAVRLSDAERLVRAARRIARAAALSRVRWWECPPPFELPSDFAGGRRIRRDGELPMLRAFRSDLRAREWSVIPRAIWV